MRQRGSVLIVVLWALVILGVGVFSSLYATRLEIRVARNQGDRVQARYLALAGVARAAATVHGVVSGGERRTSEAERRLRDDDLREFRDTELGRGVYRVVRSARPSERTGQPRFALDDEESRLDVNTAAPQELARIPDLTEDVAAALVDWRDPDGRLTPMGAEADYYAELSPPYRIANAPFDTLTELLRVRGVTAERLFGEDRNGNQRLDPEEDDGRATAPPDNADGALDGGWSALLTVHAAVRNVSAEGRPRVNVTSADADALGAVEHLPGDIAQAIVDARRVRSLESLVDLLEVRRVEKVERPRGGRPGSNPARPSGNAPRPTTGQPAGGASNPGAAGSGQPGSGQPGSGQPGSGQPGSGQPGSSQPGGGASAGTEQYREVGSPLISRALLLQIADGLTVREPVLRGVVNINAAGPEVLACLPGMTEELAQAVAQHRLRQGPFESIAELLDVAGMTTALFKQLNPRICIRSDTWRISAEGEIASSGARQRVVAVIRFGERGMTTLYYREEP